MTRTHTQQIADHFASDWMEYDRQIRQVIPFYDQALTTLCEVAVACCPRAERILDIGIGTGNLAERLLEAFPAAHLTGIDLVPEFIQRAEHRLGAHPSRVTLACADVALFDFSATYDLVVTSFVFHHLQDSLKRCLYSQALSSLAPFGLLINLDFVHSASEHCACVFDRLRVAAMSAQGVGEERIQREYVEHRQLETPTPLEVQLQWLREAGYADVECYWKYLNLAMFGGRRSESSP